VREGRKSFHVKETIAKSKGTEEKGELKRRTHPSFCLHVGGEMFENVYSEREGLERASQKRKEKGLRNWSSGPRTIKGGGGSKKDCIPWGPRGDWRCDRRVLLANLPGKKRKGLELGERENSSSHCRQKEKSRKN